MIKELFGFCYHTLLCTALDQSIERYLINMEKVTLSIFKEKLDNLNGFLDLIALDTTVQEYIEEDFSTFRTNDSAFDNFARVVELLSHWSQLGRAAALKKDVFLFNAGSGRTLVLNTSCCHDSWLLLNC